LIKKKEAEINTKRGSTSKKCKSRGSQTRTGLVILWVMSLVKEMGKRIGGRDVTQEVLNKGRCTKKTKKKRKKKIASADVMTINSNRKSTQGKDKERGSRFFKQERTEAWGLV